ncbi:MAG: Ig-like domain-containing protein, partial [Treponema sp.]|nr:Ig-like domain-containing protein [Treponema sp.]
GNVSAHSAGTAIITVKTDDGDFTDTSIVTVIKKIVNVPVSSVSLSPSILTLNVGGEGELTANIAPVNATNKARSWSSDNPGVATVDLNGIVTAHSAGTATITVTTADGGKTATSTVTVRTPPIAVTGVRLSQTSLSLDKGDEADLVAFVDPADAANLDVAWSSSNPSVATVSNGLVIGMGVGTAIITVTTDDGGFEASCTVTVTEEIVAPSTPHDVTIRIDGFEDVTFASSYADGTIGVDPAYDLKAWYVNGAKYEGDIDSLNQFLTTLSLGTYNIKLIALDDNEVPYSNNIEVEITENDEPDPSSSFNISIIIGSFEDAYFASSHDDGTIGVDPAYDLKAWYLNGVKQEGTIDDLNSFIATLGQGDYEIKLIALDRNNVPYSNIVTLEVY